MTIPTIEMIVEENVNYDPSILVEALQKREAMIVKQAKIEELQRYNAVNKAYTDYPYDRIKELETGS